MPGKVTQPVKPRYTLFYLANLITLSQPDRSIVDRLYLPSKLRGTRRLAGGDVWFRPDNESQETSD